MKQLGNHASRFATCLFGLIIGFGCPTTGMQAGEPLLTPAPREVAWTADRLDLGTQCTFVAGAEEAPVARVVAAELKRLHGITADVASESFRGPKIILALDRTPAGKALLEKMPADMKAKWPPKRNSQEGYLLTVDDREAAIVAATPRGLLYGCQTLMQLLEPAAGGQGKQLRGARILDYPQLGFRSLHICIFPNTELAGIRQAILFAARYKYNAVVIEPWSSLKSKKHPETAYENTYTPEQIRPLVELCRALQLDVVPMLNSWGHASGMRSRSSEHVVLDRFPEYKGLYEPSGWAYALTNPAVRPYLFDRYEELLELCGPVRYFHVGMDEARGRLPNTTFKSLEEHLQGICDFFKKRDIQVFMWHDMFLQANDPELGKVSRAFSKPPLNSHLALPGLPKDVIIAAWEYDTTDEWPVPKYFQDKGFRVVVCPWKSRRNTVMLLNVAKKHDMFGLLQTTWDSLDVALPSVGQAGVLAWTDRGSNLDKIPFEHWLGELRRLPICDLPKLENAR
jgi:hexosaminidase